MEALANRRRIFFRKALVTGFGVFFTVLAVHVFIAVRGHYDRLAIYDATFGGDLVKVKALLGKNPELIYSINFDGLTRFDCAVRSDHMEMAKFLFTRQPQIDFRDEWGTPL